MEKREDPLKQKVFTSVIWKFGEQLNSRFITFLVSLLLARLLLPADYGLVSLITVFITLAEIIVGSGFGTSLVQRSAADDLDFSSVFYFSMATVVLLYVLLFFAAPVIAGFYKNEAITLLLRVLGLRLIFCGVNVAQNAYVEKNMLFKRFFFSTIIGTLLSGVVALVMAFNGFGMWALVAQSLVQAALGTGILWFTVKWRPKLMFSFGRMKSLYSYGWKLFAAAIISALYNELRSLIIGRLYTSADLGLYTKGKSFPNLINNNLTGTISSVLFPALSQKQADIEKVKDMTRRSIKVTCFLIIPLMAGLAIVARPLVLLLLTEKWAGCIPYLQIACYSAALIPIQTANMQAVKALGKSGTYLKIDIAKRVVGVTILLLVMYHGVMAIALSAMLNSTIFMVLNALPNKKLLGYSVFEQVKDILPYVGMTAVMAAVIFPLQYLGLPLLALLALQVVGGAGVYLLLAVLFKVDSLPYLWEILKLQLARFRNKRTRE